MFNLAIENFGPINRLIVIEETGRVSYELSLNENTLLVGRSGCGKTSLVALLHFLPFVALLKYIPEELKSITRGILDKFLHRYCRETTQIDVLFNTVNLLERDIIESLTNKPYSIAYEEYPNLLVRFSWSSEKRDWIIKIYLLDKNHNLVRVPDNFVSEVVLKIVENLCQIVTLPEIVIRYLNEYISSFMKLIQSLVVLKSNTLMHIFDILITTRLPLVNPTIWILYEEGYERLDLPLPDYFHMLEEVLIQPNDLVYRKFDIYLRDNEFELKVSEAQESIYLEACSIGGITSTLVNHVLNVAKYLAERNYGVILALDDISYGLTHRDVQQVFEGICSFVSNRRIGLIIATHRFEVPPLTEHLKRIYIFTRRMPELIDYVRTRYGLKPEYASNVLISPNVEQKVAEIAMKYLAPHEISR